MLLCMYIGVTLLSNRIPLSDTHSLPRSLLYRILKIISACCFQ